MEGFEVLSVREVLANSLAADVGSSEAKQYDVSLFIFSPASTVPDHLFRRKREDDLQVTLLDLLLRRSCHRVC